MKTKTKILHIILWTTTFLLGSFLFALPTITEADILTTDISALEHKGIYLTRHFRLDDFTANPGDRIIRINDCSIENHLEGQCGFSEPSSRNSYEIIRDGQSLEFQTSSPPVLFPRILSRLPQIAGAVTMLICGLLLLLNISKVRWFPHMLILSLLFSLIFIYEAIQLPLLWFTLPRLFWSYHALRVLTYSSIYAAAINLVLIYPQHRFNKKGTRLILLGINLSLPILATIFIVLNNSDILTGLRLANQWCSGYSVLLLAALCLTLVYHIRTSKGPMVNLRMRWIRIGAITVGLLLASISAAFVLSSGTNYFPVLFQLDSGLKILSHPFTLLIVLTPLFYAIPLAEQFPRKIDNLENRVLFYLLMGGMLLTFYTLFILLLFKFNILQIANSPIVFVEFGLMIAVMLVLALLRSPVDTLVNRWFYRDRLKFQTLIPGFLLELSSNLNYTELINLLLIKLPKDFNITSAGLILRDSGGESYSQVSLDDNEPPVQFSKSHPLIQHFQGNAKPILRYLDQKMLHPGIIAIMEKSSLEAAIPLIHLGNLVGIYFLQKKTNGKPYSIGELKILSELNQWAGTAIYNTWVVTQKEDYSRSLEIEMAQQSRELDRVVDETLQYRRSNQKLSVQQESILTQVQQDLNGPMEDIINISQELASENLESPSIDFQKLLENSHRLSKRLNTFLEYSTLQNESFQAKSDRCDLSQLFESILVELKQEIPNIEEIISFHLEADTPMVVLLDLEQTRKILLLLVRISLNLFPQQAFVITCLQQEKNTSEETQSHSLSFQCDHHHEAILLHKTQVTADQIPLNIELIQLLCHRMGGDLQQTPLDGDASHPFQFSLQISIPTDSFPAFMGVNLPFLTGKSLMILECDPIILKRMTLQANSWGMQVSTVSNHKEVLELLALADLPDLLLANGECLSIQEPDQPEGLLPSSLKTILYHRLADNSDDVTMENSSAPNFNPSEMYRLITRALLFSTTTEKYPHLPKELQLEQAAMTKTRNVLIVGEEENQQNLLLYFSRFNLETYQYDGNLIDLPAYLRQQEIDILVFELASSDLREWDILANIRKIDLYTPFIIAISANSIRYPALTALKSGANKYLLKPYALEELLLLVADWLNQSATTGSNN